MEHAGLCVIYTLSDNRERAREHKLVCKQIVERAMRRPTNYCMRETFNAYTSLELKQNSMWTLYVVLRTGECYVKDF